MTELFRRLLSYQPREPRDRAGQLASRGGVQVTAQRLRRSPIRALASHGDRRDRRTAGPRCRSAFLVPALQDELRHLDADVDLGPPGVQQLPDLLDRLVRRVVGRR